MIMASVDLNMCVILIGRMRDSLEGNCAENRTKIWDFCYAEDM